MPQRDGYIPGVPCWVDTMQPDTDAATSFYAGLFGWEFTNVTGPDAKGPYLVARLRGLDVAAVAPAPPDGPPQAVWLMYVAVESADDTAEKVTEAGGTVLMAPFDAEDAGRAGVFKDPEGSVFCVWEPRAFKGAVLVNEPGSLNFNGLHTRDVDTAKKFYGEVFGWTTLGLPDGTEMWTLPGYGDHLAIARPTLREDMAKVGAIPGFEDVVATVVPITAEQAEMPPHWDVTFAVEDADATAAKATELGARIIAGPFDAPWVRMAVIADPQGGVFIASQFVMENRPPADAA